jgi:hypothetical protein
MGAVTLVPAFVRLATHTTHTNNINRSRPLTCYIHSKLKMYLLINHKKKLFLKEKKTVKRLFTSVRIFRSNFKSYVFIDDVAVFEGNDVSKLSCAYLSGIPVALGI